MTDREIEAAAQSLQVNMMAAGEHVHIDHCRHLARGALEAAEREREKDKLQ